MITQATLLARLIRATTALKAGPRARKARQLRRRINRVIAEIDLPTYISFFNRDADGWSLEDNLDHWAEINVHTALDLARYLDACVAREREKDSRW